MPQAIVVHKSVEFNYVINKNNLYYIVREEKRMAISTEQLLILLRRRYTISTFYRLFTKAAFQSSVRIPQGYLLLSQNGEE